VPFHVEIRRSLQRARVFNLGKADLERGVLEPWARGGPVALGGQEWDPRESTLTVLEGPALEAPDLAHGQGWQRAQRSARDVSADVLRVRAAAVAIAVLAESPAAQDVAAAALQLLGVAVVAWSTVRARLVAGAAAGDRVAGAVLIFGGEAEPARPLDAGLAVGAFGRRAVIACVDSALVEPGLRELDVLVLDADRDAAAQALAARLREAIGDPTPR
jgi:hypothetical protein